MSKMGKVKYTETFGRRVTEPRQTSSVNWAAQASIGNRTTAVKTVMQINSSKTVIVRKQ